ncbi:hypothetical protein FRB96_009068 [Tulasnella sp. 330]|nr:hypothetical protein FRB96_009068 [Tulasnella sp. 330]
MSSNTVNQEKDTWSSTLYNTNASFVYSKQYTSAVLGLLDPKPGEKIIDFGCGTGEVTKELEQIVGKDGLVIDKARQNGLERTFVGDVQDLVYPVELASLRGSFDAVFTNAVLHWCKRDPAGVVSSARQALKADGKGRYVEMALMEELEVDNEHSQFLQGLRSALHIVLESKGMDAKSLDPWFFPSVQEYKTLLEKGGFQVTHISLNPRITPLPGRLIDWLRTFCRESFLADLNEAEAEELMLLVEDKCAVDMRDSDGGWSVMYARLRFVAILPAATT